MVLNGIRTYGTKKVTFRMANPKIDKDKDGKPVESNYVVFVRVSNCKKYWETPRRYAYDATGVECIPVGYGGTFYGYGKWVKRGHVFGIWVDNIDTGGREVATSYYQCSVYFVHKGKVRIGSIRRAISPKSTKIYKQHNDS